MSSYVVGLTGGIASGKSNLSRALRAHGAPVVDADEISRSLTAEGGAALPMIREAFGDGVFDGDALDRRRLGDTIFADKEKRERLNGILHPMIFLELRARLDAVEGAAVLEAPLLYETGLDKWCDEVWCAYVPQKEQVRRVRKRDKVTYRRAYARVRSQMPSLEKARRSARVIRTDGTKDDSAAIVLALWDELIDTLSKK